MTHTVPARDAILAAIRDVKRARVGLPDVHLSQGEPSSAVGKFTDTATAAGARVVTEPRANVRAAGASLFPDAIRILSATPAVDGNVALPLDVKSLADVDLFVIDAAFGVAENGAVWLAGLDNATRAALFLATNVLVLLDQSAIVADLHSAYARIDIRAQPFGVFVAGPSKTADIEQSLVVGAHGPLSFTIMLVQPG